MLSDILEFVLIRENPRLFWILAGGERIGSRDFALFRFRNKTQLVNRRGLCGCESVSTGEESVKVEVPESGERCKREKQDLLSQTVPQSITQP